MFGNLLTCYNYNLSGGIMTGNEIYNKLTSSDFYSKALDFKIQKILEFESEREASAFLSLYCTLLVENQYDDFNEERLSKSYQKINTLILQNKTLSTKEFLENPKKEDIYLLRGNLCRVLHII